MIICRLPSFLQCFFRPFQTRLSDDQFRHLWSFVLALVVNLRAAKLLHLSNLTPIAGHRTRHGAFCAQSNWDAPALLHDSAINLLSGMKPRPGEVIYLILDDNRIAKRGRKMDHVSKIWDHKQQRFVRGHIVLTCAICFRGVVLPWRIDLWKPKGHRGPRYRKLTDMAAQMIRDFAAPAGLKVRALFDAFYLCPTVTQACVSKGFFFFSVAQRSRNFTTANGKRRKIARLMPGLIRHQGQTVRMKRSRGKQATLRIAAVDGHLSRIGKVRMVISKRPRGPWKKCIAIVSNETGLRPRQIVAVYETRWLIEVLFKELHQDLGLGDYQMLHRDGILRHLHLCCLAHLLLTRRCLSALGAQATKTNQQVNLPPMNQRLATLEHGFDPKAVDMNEVFASWDPDIMEYFIERGADVQRGNPFARAFCERIRTALRPYKACRQRMPELQEQANIALRHHCKERNVKWVSLMLWAGADPFKPGAGSPEEELDAEDEGLSALGYAALYDHFEIFELKPIRSKLGTGEGNDFIRFLDKGRGLEALKRLLEKGLNPNDEANGGCSLIGHCLESMSWWWSTSAYPWERDTNKRNLDTPQARDRIKTIHLLAKHGAKWIPADDKRDVASARRSLLRMKPDYTIEFVWIMSKYKACTRDCVQTLISTPTIKSHIAAHRARLQELLESWDEQPDPSA